MAFGVVVALFVALLVWAALVYNSLVRDRNRVAQAWSDVDVQLTRRHELVPRLVEIVKGYASYERALLTSLAGLRSASQGTPASRSETERAVSAPAAEAADRRAVVVEAAAGGESSHRSNACAVRAFGITPWHFDTLRKHTSGDAHFAPDA